MNVKIKTNFIVQIGVKKDGFATNLNYHRSLLKIISKMLKW
jgi:hypothetical protein